MKRLPFLESSLGKKAIIATTGAIMLGFLLGHVMGNLKVFVPDPEPGTADIDVYAEFLRSLGEPLLPHGAGLWIVRLTLVAALLIHVVLVIQLSVRSRRARPIQYASQRYVQATRPARWMMLSGILVLGFVVFHLLHFTSGTIDPSSFEAGAVYANLYNAFTRWPFVVLYVVAMGAIAVHLYHGAWSMFQTLGLDSPDRNRVLRWFALVISLALFAGFAAVPLSFVSGVLDAPTEQVGSAPDRGAVPMNDSERVDND